MDAWLFVLCVSMFLGSFGAGLIPLMVHLSESKLRLVSGYGAGLLVGTALIVIIPEGADTFYRSVESKVIYKCPDSTTPDSHQHAQHLNKRQPVAMAAVNANPSSTSNQHSTNNNSSQHNDDNYSHEGDSNESRTIHAHNTVPRTIGLAMVFGFGMMFLLEKLAHSISSHSRLFRMIGGGGDGMELEERSPGPTTPKPPNMSGEYSNGNTLAVLVGMIIHCAADGIALGAASSAKQSDLELLVFLAILLHKAPSAFGLTSYLLTAGMQSRRAIKHQLLVFSIAAPATAMISSILLDMIKLTSSNTQMTEWTGILLMISAGSFLYVATMHVLPEVTQSNHHGDSCASPRYSSHVASSAGEDGGKRHTETYLTLAIGMFDLIHILSIHKY